MQSDDNNLIICKNLTIGYDNEAVVNQINLKIKRGEFLPFVGPNGSGKTTLLRTILGLLPPLDGELLHPFDSQPPGYVPQVSTLDRIYPVTAREVITMGLYPKLGLWKKPDHKMREQIDSYLERFNLIRHSERTLNELSGGMRQKVMIARALVSGAEVLIMDEPAAGLDEQSEFDLVKLLYSLAKEEQKTVLFAQHSLDPIIGLTDEVFRIYQGQSARVPINALLASRNYKQINKENKNVRSQQS
ncbi:MAG: ATP-binding cassette domain-containing protein [Candidatus Riflebacteria bacterium]|nr:ATP-binding cassette domain-containing protein [Candidatus Riflebacteria bacterium]